MFNDYDLGVKNLFFDENQDKVYVSLTLGSDEIPNKDNFMLGKNSYEILNQNLGSPITSRSIGNYFVHPTISKTDHIANEIHQKNHIIGNLVYVYPKKINGFYKGLYDITEPIAKAKFKEYSKSYENGLLPLLSSIQIIPKKTIEMAGSNGETIRVHEDFILQHNALVSESQWEDNRINGVCINGHLETCKNALASAGKTDYQTIAKNVYNQINELLDNKKSCNCSKIESAGKLDSNMSEQTNTGSDQGTNTNNNNAPKDNSSKAPVGSFDPSTFADSLGKAVGTILQSNNNFKPQDNNKQDNKETKTETNKTEPKKEEKIETDLTKQQEQKPLTEEDKYKDKLNVDYIKKIESRLNKLETNELEHKIGNTLMNNIEIFKNEKDEVDEDSFNKTLRFWSKTGLEETHFNKILEHTLAPALRRIDILSKRIAELKGKGKIELKQTEVKPIKEENKKEIEVQSAGTIEDDELLSNWYEQKEHINIVNNTRIL